MFNHVVLQGTAKCLVKSRNLLLMEKVLHSHDILWLQAEVLLVRIERKALNAGEAQAYLWSLGQLNTVWNAGLAQALHVFLGMQIEVVSVDG